jgi:ABC-type multidrug transport system ATPase subunit
MRICAIFGINDEQKIVIIAGPNGAGKTTFAREFLVPYPAVEGYRLSGPAHFSQSAGCGTFSPTIMPNFTMPKFIQIQVIQIGDLSSAI